MHIPETVKTYGIITLIVIASFWFASRFIEPPPPDRILLAAGSASGDYYRYANSYKKALAKERITVEIIETAGSLENVNLLMEGKADVAFIQSGLETKESREKIETLASLYYEPLWVFSRENDFPEKDLQNLQNKKLTIGAKGSGTNAIARQLLKLNNITEKTTLIDLSGKEAVLALQKGRVDAAFFVARPESSYIRKLLHEKNIHLLSFQRAEGYTHLLPFLSKVQLNEGVIDMAADIPDSEVYLLSPVAQLTSRTDFNGALKTLLLGSSMDIHGNADIFSTKGQFPSLDYADFPIAEEAARYFKYGPNFLQRFLPFWLADMISRMVVLLVPLLGVMLPLLKIASPVYRWRTRSKIYKWYKSLKKTEETIITGDSELREALASLELIDAEVKKPRFRFHTLMNCIVCVCIFK
jgi:hypothetical protein